MYQVALTRINNCCFSSTSFHEYPDDCVWVFKSICKLHNSLLGHPFFLIFLIRVVSEGLTEIFRQFTMWTEKVEQREGNDLVKEAVHLIH